MAFGSWFSKKPGADAPVEGSLDLKVYPNPTQADATAKPAGDATAAATPAAASDAVAKSEAEKERLVNLGLLTVRLGGATMEEVFPNGPPKKLSDDLLVINRTQDDAELNPVRWYKPWSWFFGGMQASPIIRERHHYISQVVKSDAGAAVTPAQGAGGAGHSSSSSETTSVATATTTTTTKKGESQAESSKFAADHTEEGKSAALTGGAARDSVQEVFDEEEERRRAEREAAKAVTIALVNVGGARPIREIVLTKRARKRKASASGSSGSAAKGSEEDTKLGRASDIGSSAANHAGAGKDGSKTAKPTALPPIEMRMLTEKEVAPLEEVVKRDRKKVLESEEKIHEMLQNIEDTRYRFLVPSQDLLCEREVVHVAQCYAHINEKADQEEAADASHRSATLPMPPSSSSSSQRDSSASSRGKNAPGSNLKHFSSEALQCGFAVELLKQCAERMVVGYSEGELA